MPPIQQISDTHSELATISQQPEAFDFPRNELPASFHYTGPFIDPRAEVFHVIAAACAGVHAQLVVGLGAGLRPEVQSYVPQFQLLGRASLMVTDAGMNSALECLAQGVPRLLFRSLTTSPTLLSESYGPVPGRCCPSNP